MVAPLGATASNPYLLDDRGRLEHRLGRALGRLLGCRRRSADRRVGVFAVCGDVEPGRFVAFDIPPGGGATGEASYLVEPTSASTSALTSRVQLRFSGLGRLIEPFMGRVLRRDVERDDQVLRALLEAEA